MRNRDENGSAAGGYRGSKKLCWSCAIFILIVQIIPAVRSEKFGALRLCPAGGRSFMVAWNLACEMKRKKRSVEDPTLHDDSKRATAPDGYIAATLSDIMHICCDVGCDIRDLLSYCDPFGSWNS